MQLCIKPTITIFNYFEACGFKLVLGEEIKKFCLITSWMYDDAVWIEMTTGLFLLYSTACMFLLLYYG